jgi:hypothetical protein
MTGSYCLYITENQTEINDVECGMGGKGTPWSFPALMIMADIYQIYAGFKTLLI